MLVSAVASLRWQKKKVLLCKNDGCCHAQNDHFGAACHQIHEALVVKFHKWTDGASCTKKTPTPKSKVNDSSESLNE